MDERIRHRIMRLSWIVLCAIPTSFNAVWCGYRQTPYYAQTNTEHWQRELSRMLGAELFMARVEQPQPGHARFHNLRVVDPETSIPWVRIDRLDAVQSDHGWVLVVPRAEMLGEQLPEFLAIVHDRFLRRTRAADAELELFVEQLTLREATSNRTARNLQVRIRHAVEGPRAEIEAVLAGDADAKPVRLTVARHRQQSPALTRWTLDTRRSPFPCADLARWLPGLMMLGEGCDFEGLLTFQNPGAGWEGSLQGRFSPVDLQAVARQVTGHSLSGSGELLIFDAEFSGGRIVDATGELHFQDGRIGRPFALALASNSGLRFRPASRLEKMRQAEFAFRQLAMAFRVSEQGLELRGRCEPDRSNAILTDDEGPLLAEPGSSHIPVASLIRALSSDREATVPATREAERVSAVLPLPNANVASGDRPQPR